MNPPAPMTQALNAAIELGDRLPPPYATRIRELVLPISTAARCGDQATVMLKLAELLDELTDALTTRARVA